MTSIPGVGIATATEVILAADEIKASNDPKSWQLRPLDCHAGVAPFDGGGQFVGFWDGRQIKITVRQTFGFNQTPRP